jgi:hypothetical protein
VEPINVKMKLADPAEVDRMLTAALHESGWLNGQVDAVAADLVRSVHKVLFQSGCVLIQVDV